MTKRKIIISIYLLFIFSVSSFFSYKWGMSDGKMKSNSIYQKINKSHLLIDSLRLYLQHIDTSRIDDKELYNYCGMYINERFVELLKEDKSLGIPKFFNTLAKFQDALEYDEMMKEPFIYTIFIGGVDRYSLPFDDNEPPTSGYSREYERFKPEYFDFRFLSHNNYFIFNPEIPKKITTWKINNHVLYVKSDSVSSLYKQSDQKSSSDTNMYVFNNKYKMVNITKYVNMLSPQVFNYNSEFIKEVLDLYLKDKCGYYYGNYWDYWE